MARTKVPAVVDAAEDTGASSRPSRGTGGRRQAIPPCVQNPDFPSLFAKWEKRKIIPEKGITVTELGDTPIPGMIERRGWQTYVQHPPRYCRRIVEEFYAGMVPRNYLLGGAVWVRGKEVRVNASDINRYYRTPVSVEDRERMYRGLPKNDIFQKMNVELANALTDFPLPFWHTRSSPLKQSKIHIDLAFWHVFISYSLRPSQHRTTVAYEVAQILYCLRHDEPIDVGALIKMEIHKCAKDESKKEAMGFPSLITQLCLQAGVDLTMEEMREAPVDIGINQWFSLYPSRGLQRPGGHKRARRDDVDSGPGSEAEQSESDAEGPDAEEPEPESGPEAGDGVLLSEDDESKSRWSRMLSALKLTRRLEKKERAAARDRQMKEVRAMKEAILGEIAASEGRTRALISEVEDGLMQDFAELRTDLHVSQYTRQKKAYPFPPEHPRPTGGPVISEEEAQMRMAMERSLKEQAEREARTSKGKGKMSGSS